MPLQPSRATTAQQRKRRRRGSGALRQLPSGRWQARFTGPDGTLHTAGRTFDTKLDAAAWLSGQERDLERGSWSPPQQCQPVGTLAAYAEQWLQARDIKPRTRSHYRGLLERVILPDLGGVPLDRLTPSSVRTWHASLDPGKPTIRAHAYGLLRAIYSTAVADDLVEANPCRVRSGGSTRPRHETKIASLAELEAIVEAMPDRYRPLVLLAAWCGLRFGELAELRRGDVDLERATVQVARGVVRVDGEMVVGTPKSHAGRRSVTIPPHLVPMLEQHLARHVAAKPDALLFPARHGGHLAPSTLYKVFYPAREQAGRPDLRFHDLRHTGATLAAATGATLGDLMQRLGHSTAGAAIRYQHAAADRDRAIAEALSGFAQAKKVGLKRVR